MIPPIKGAIVPGGWFTEFFLITFLLPFIADRKKAMKYGMISVFAVMMLLVVINLIALFVLGTTTASRPYPIFSVIRYISTADFFEHLESGISRLGSRGVCQNICVFLCGCFRYCAVAKSFRIPARCMACRDSNLRI